MNQAAGRAWLRTQLEAHCTQIDRHLNYIRVEERSLGNGHVALYCTHDLYTRHAFSTGERGPAMQRFIALNAEVLTKHKVSRVGVWGTDRNASGTWFNVSSH